MKLHIGSAEDLLRALSHEDLAVVAATHRTLRRQPARAIAFGPWQGRDVVDALLEQAARRDQRLALLATQSVTLFDDTRVHAHFLRSLTEARGWRFEAARVHLAQHRHAWRRSDLFDALRDMTSAHRPRVVAALLGAVLADDPQDVAFRLALLHDPVPPLPDDTTLASWRRELSGPLAAEARVAAEAGGQPAFEPLAAHRRELPAECLPWLLEWGVREWAKAAITIEMLREALSDEDDPAVSARLRAHACRLVEANPGLHPAVRAPLQRLARCDDVKARRQAVQAGAVVDWAEAVRRETDGQMRALCLLRWGAQAPTDVLVGLLADADWHVRAASAEILAGRGAADPTGLDAVRALVGHSRVEVRAAAVQVLTALGEVATLEETLLTP